jgi:DNA-binding GntR family transcriptional regulator
MRTNMKIEQPKSLTEMVMARLEQAIVDGEFRLGEAISEETLAKTFGVSRTPVRDALTALQRSGLVVVLPKRGSFVFQPSAADTAALCDYRFLLEREGLRLSRIAAPEETLVAMNTAIVAMEASLTVDAVAYGRADTQFHQAFLDHCGNPYLADAYRLASGKVAALRTHLTAHVEARRTHSLDEHQRMAAYFESGNLDALFVLLTEHINRTRQVYEAALAAPEPGPRRLALI